MMSIKELHAGDGYTYLLRGVADGEGITGVVSPMSRYYAESGHPPGRWMGTGRAGLADGAGLAAGEHVTEEQMERLFKHGTDPLTGHPLGRRYNQPRSWRERAEARIRALPTTLTGQERAARTAAIEAEERARPTRRPVAGFDCVFSPPKSVSTLWALAEPSVRDQIAHAHYVAIDEVIRVMERDVARTRVGTDGVAQVEARGLIATAFDHYDSRAGDPQLHTHVVIANRVQGPDGKWRTLDSRGSLFPAAVAMSELYDTLLADQLTSRLGVQWERRGTPAKPKNQSWEISGVPHELITEFSRRARGIETVTHELIAAYRATHGRDPDDVTIVRLRQQATYSTRPDKQFRSLAEMSADWRARATTYVGPDPQRWARDLISRAAHTPVPAPSDKGVAPLIDQLAAEALDELSTERSTWRTWNVRAAAARASMPHRVSTPAERDALIEAISRRVTEMSVNITPPELAFTPEKFRRKDGTSAFRRTHGDIFTTNSILDAEDRLLVACETLTAPVLNPNTVERAVVTSSPNGLTTSIDQATAVQQIATSARMLDVLVGAAGSGKTTALATLRSAWEAKHGRGSVVGLAPSAAAAEVLGESLGIPTENTAKWLFESTGATNQHRSPAVEGPAKHRVPVKAQPWSFRAGQLVIVDEASLAGTLALDALRAQAQAASAKLLLVGDNAQLSSIDAGGAFGMLVRELGDRVLELTDIRRFIHPWERDASKRLRVGDTGAIETYIDHDRVRDGDREQIIDSAYRAWQADEAAGHRSLLIATDAATVRDLNERARTDQVAAGCVEPGGVTLHDGTSAGRGDRIVTRQNMRNLATGPRSFVKNGDQWLVRQRDDDGSLIVARQSGGPSVTLPAGYVAEHVELAYATTAHRAQGRTVDTAHAIIDDTRSTREALYVSMTRGAHANSAYVITELTDEEIPDDHVRTARDVLCEVIKRSGAELSARETIADQQQQVTSIARLAAEYETIAREAAADHWSGIIGACPLPRLRDFPTTSPSYPLLVTAMRRAEAIDLNPEQLLPRLATAEELDRFDDPIAVLHHRLDQLTEHAAATRSDPGQQHLIAGLFPVAKHVSDPALRRALDERAVLIGRRAFELAHRAIAEQPRWLAELGPAPDDTTKRDQWLRYLATVSAYRNRYGVPDNVAVNSHPTSVLGQRVDQRRAGEAAAQSRHLSSEFLALPARAQPKRRPAPSPVL
ncbi:MobF family relaxase [Phytoactinopolyspora mesophila]|uniref:Relaxase domain-containing protein n=1 Tax=Phytoactinopolyspora mesophila TaxID=2650750 RepID=A0A7K3M165_9ACTN|nr:MobF family relaxase [Phytoactinopolyspora mesophila]NDL57014.1 relaxase domain-containing protein [Phytoactinopolyspora mesophila]